MNVIENINDYKISQDIFYKICKELIGELNTNRASFEKIKELDYEYNKVNLNIDRFIEIIKKFSEKKVKKIEKTNNNIIIHSGHPYVSLNILLQGLINSQVVNLIIEDMFVGINKFIFKILTDVLSEYKMKNIISLNVYKKKDDFKNISSNIDKIICIGSRNNIYNTCKKFVNMDFIPFNELFIFFENDELYELARDVFDYCNELGVEAEILENMNIDNAIDLINRLGDIYCSVILTKNIVNKEIFIDNVNSRFAFANENPFKENLFEVPEIW